MVAEAVPPLSSVLSLPQAMNVVPHSSSIMLRKNLVVL
jgi:hypothetical protein